MADPTKNDRDLSRVVKLSSALGMGIMAGFIYSVKAVHPSIRFEFSAGVILAALLVGAATWAFFAVIFREEQRLENDSSFAGRKRRSTFLNRWMLLFVTATIIGTIFAFARSLRGISGQQVRDMVVGTVAAVLFVSFFLYLLWRLFRFLEQDSERQARLAEETEERDSSDR